jgi:predicted glycogen debranching enzyme
MQANDQGNTTETAAVEADSVRDAAMKSAAEHDEPPFLRGFPRIEATDEIASEGVKRMPWSSAVAHNPERLVGWEWLLTNGLGGYASGTVAWEATRRYHGLLIAALPAPLGRVMMFNHVVEELRLSDNSVIALVAQHPVDSGPGGSEATLTNFKVDHGLPTWRYEAGPYTIERRILMPHRSNTVYLSYRLVSGPGQVHLRLRPFLHFRLHDASVATPGTWPYTIISHGNQFEVNASELPALRMVLRGPPGALVLDGGTLRHTDYLLERARGYDHEGMLWSPGYFRVELAPEGETALCASTESWETILAVEPAAALESELNRRQRLVAQADPGAQTGLGAELVLAADEFIITPTTRIADAARAHAAGEEILAVIAGYHWFTDWGRDTMISLEGLTLCTGRHVEAGYLLRMFAYYVRDGLIPNLFPEGELTGVYHTADATLWYFHALDRYLHVTGDRITLRQLIPTLRDIVDHHLRGTRFGIHVDPRDGLLSQGEAGYQLTWMDAKVGDWVVTPRRGKAVEINALWYNAVYLLAGWLADEGLAAEAAEMHEHAARAYASFNSRFWCAEKGWLYDVVDGEGPDDPSLRPNQLFAISLPNPVLDKARWPAVMRVVVERLLTPMGLRTLAPGEPGYQPKYDGDLRARDAAYHQGTAWPWLVGPLVDAWLKVHPDQPQVARDFLSGFAVHMSEACVGTISEICDAEAPYSPRGCIAQAWSVAEVLRCWLKAMSAGAAMR